MQNESKLFGAKATSSFKKSFDQSFNQSILKLSFLYGTILVAILFISGVITFNEFSGRIGKRFNTIPPTITIQLPNGGVIATTAPNVILHPGAKDKIKNQISNQISNQIRNEQKKQAQMPTAEDIRADLIASILDDETGALALGMNLRAQHVHQRGDSNRLEVEAKIAALEARELQHVGDQP